MRCTGQALPQTGAAGVISHGTADDASIPNAKPSKLFWLFRRAVFQGFLNWRTGRDVAVSRLLSQA